jgi:uncharacterized protein
MRELKSMAERIELETATIQDIPVLTLAPHSAQNCPVVFFIPGFGGNKEAGLSIGYQLARRGCFCVTFDPWLHGARYDQRIERAAQPDEGGVYLPETGLDTFMLFYGIIQRCALDVQALIDYYAADPRADIRRCGVTGLSMGGYASFLAFANVPQIQAAVPMIGVPSFTRRWLDLIDECAFSNPEWAAALDRVADQTRHHTAFVQEIDPIEKLKVATPRALLIMNCDFNSDQPKAYSINCYRDLKPRYAQCPEKLKLNIYPVGHTVTPAMEHDAVEWFGQHL